MPQDKAPGGTMPSVITLDDQVTFVTDPVNPCSGTDFTVSWQEKNVGDEASVDYQDIFDMDDQGTGDSKQLSCGGLAPGETALRTLTFNLPAGDYKMSLVINGVGPVTLGNVIVDDCPPGSADGSGNEQVTTGESGNE